MNGGATFTAAIGTLDGSGTVNGPVTVGVGGVQPGTPTTAGVLTVGAITFNTGSNFNVNPNGDELVVNGTATLTGGTLNILSALNYNVPNTPITILHSTGGLGGTTFTNAAPGQILMAADGTLYTVTYTATDVDITLVPVTVTSSNVSIADSSMFITLAGSGFSSTPSDDYVSFSSGVVGTVTSVGGTNGLTATQLVVSVTNPPTARRPDRRGHCWRLQQQRHARAGGYGDKWDLDCHRPQRCGG